jgi:predicted DNA-binding transcriptional regulator AlpA
LNPTPKAGDYVTETTEDKWLTSAEVATHLGMSERAIRDMVQVGWFPRPVMFGGSKRWRLKTVIEWKLALEVIQALTPRMIRKFPSENGKKRQLPAKSGDDQEPAGIAKKPR